MQNHRPARAKRKRVRTRWTAPYTSIPHINGPASAAGPSVMTVGVWLSGPCRLADLPDDRPVPAAEEASVGRRPVAAGRAFARRHPAADPGADCPAAVGSASAGSGCSCTSPAYWLPQRALTLTRGTAESCDAKRPIARAKLGTDTGANFAKVPPRTESAFTPAYKRDRGRRARDRWARRAPFRPRRKTRCGSRPI